MIPKENKQNYIMSLDIAHIITRVALFLIIYICKHICLEEFYPLLIGKFKWLWQHQITEHCFKRTHSEKVKRLVKNAKCFMLKNQ